MSQFDPKAAAVLLLDKNPEQAKLILYAAAGVQPPLTLKGLAMELQKMPKATTVGLPPPRTPNELVQDYVEALQALMLPVKPAVTEPEYLVEEPTMHEEPESAEEAPAEPVPAPQPRARRPRKPGQPPSEMLLVTQPEPRRTAEPVEPAIVSPITKAAPGKPSRTDAPNPAQPRYRGDTDRISPLRPEKFLPLLAVGGLVVVFLCVGLLMAIQGRNQTATTIPTAAKPTAAAPGAKTPVRSNEAKGTPQPTPVPVLPQSSMEILCLVRTTQTSATFTLTDGGTAGVELPGSIPYTYRGRKITQADLGTLPRCK